MLGRKGTPKKASTVSTDRSRIDAHIKPLLGQLKACEVRRSDIETFKIGVATGTTARDVKLGKQRRSIVRGGKGALTRTIGLLGAVFAWGMENGYVEHNPVRGVKWSADKQKNALLTSEQYRWLALALDWLDARRDANAERMHSAVGLADIRFIAPSGVRRGEAPPSNVVQFQPRGRWSAVTEPSARGLAVVGRSSHCRVRRLPAESATTLSG